MHVQLHQWLVAYAAESVDLPGLDDKNVARAGFEFIAIHSPEATPLYHELNFIVGMPVRARPAPWQSTQEEHGDVHIAII